MRVLRPAGLLIALWGCAFHPEPLAGPDGSVPMADGPALRDGPGADGEAADAAPIHCLSILSTSGGSFVVEAQPQLNSDDNDRDPVLSPDGLSLYLSSGRSGLGGQDIFVATRLDLVSDFGMPVHVPDLSSDLGDTRVSLSPDTLTVTLGSSRGGGLGGVDVWQGTRAVVTDPFSGFTTGPFANVNTVGDDHDPSVAASQLRVYLAQVSALGDQDLVVASRASTGDLFGVPATVPVVNSLSGDADPFLSADERVLLFGSSRDGGGDLYYAVRDTPDLDFDPPAPLPGVNTAAEEGDPTMTDDGCELYFSSERAGGLGGRDVWRARFLVP